MYRPKDRNIYNWSKISAGDYLLAFLDELSMIENKQVVLNNEAEIMRVIAILEGGANRSFERLRTIHRNFETWYEQKMKFTGSNLRKGYIPYFVCNGCLRRAKYLYYQPYNSDNSPLCRNCNKLRYQQPKRRVRRLSRLLNRQYLSSEHKYQLIKDTGITAEDVIATGLNKSL
jgi:uncharacterized protein YjiS (DUF1127 family)